MSNYTIRHFTSDDVPQVMALQLAYQRVYSDAAVIPGEAYLSAGFAGGENIFCAFDDTGCLQGYAPLFPNLAVDPQMPHTVWAEVKVHPELAAPRELKNLLFDRVIHRTRELTQADLERCIRLTFQYQPSEAASIDYVLSRGGVYAESVFRMMCSLDQELPSVSAPDGVTVRRWRMETPTEQQAYVQARNEGLPDSPVTLADWQYFLSSPAWQEGTTLTAFDGQEIVGSVAVFWDEAISQQAGRKAGITEYIFVRAPWRRRGIAAYLICQSLLYLKEHAREAAYLEVKVANQRALDLYQRLGYRVIDESRLYVLEV